MAVELDRMNIDEVVEERCVSMGLVSRSISVRRKSQVSWSSVIQPEVSMVPLGKEREIEVQAKGAKGGKTIAGFSPLRSLRVTC